MGDLNDRIGNQSIEEKKEQMRSQLLTGIWGGGGETSASLMNLE
jgi:hypothetical protein